MVKEVVSRGASPSTYSRHKPNSPGGPGRADPNRAEPNRTGASSGLERGGIEAYFAHHLHSARSSLMRLLIAPLASLLTWLVIAVALALPAGLMAMLSNLSGITNHLASSSQLTIYMELNQNDQHASLLASQIEIRNDVESVEFIDRQRALEEFKLSSGWGDVLDYLDENPLPSVIVVQPALLINDVAGVSKLNADLVALPGVDNVQADLQWVKRLAAVFDLLERFLLALSVLFGTAVVLVIGNTIRLTIENRRDEIVVMKLVGGTNAYVRRPFLYIGFWYGIVGAAMAWLLLNIALLWLSRPINELAVLYYSNHSLQGLSLSQTSGLLFAGAFLGIIGSWLAVRRHLDDIEPT